MKPVGTRRRRDCFDDGAINFGSGFRSPVDRQAMGRTLVHVHMDSDQAEQDTGTGRNPDVLLRAATVGLPSGWESPRGLDRPKRQEKRGKSGTYAVVDSKPETSLEFVAHITKSTTTIIVPVDHPRPRLARCPLASGQHSLCSLAAHQPDLATSNRRMRGLHQCTSAAYLRYYVQRFGGGLTLPKLRPSPSNSNPRTIVVITAVPPFPDILQASDDSMCPHGTFFRGALYTAVAIGSLDTRRHPESILAASEESGEQNSRSCSVNTKPMSSAAICGSTSSCTTAKPRAMGSASSNGTASSPSISWLYELAPARGNHEELNDVKSKSVTDTFGVGLGHYEHETGFRDVKGDFVRQLLPVGAGRSSMAAGGGRGG
ncbi:hypothetical protein C8F01DRAFT_1088071 [Mycena amicta]|nr:hypothetical protein C8F01DRAFT_1088071 [Mycena amicta]